jgi:PKD repeat protein
VVGHEVSEAINDPLNAVTSWYDYSYNGEIADKCDGQPAATNGPWTVETLWSNRDKACQAGESAFHAPTASFLASSIGSVGQQLSFDAGSSSDPAADSDSALNQSTGKTFSISSGIGSYRWNWGDGTAAGSGSTASHAFSAAGNYQVSLTVTDQLGFTSTKTQQVSISGGGPGTPVVSTQGATSVSDTGATLNGAINPNGLTVSYQFSYGTSPGALTLSTPVTSGPAGQSPTPVSATISGLSSSTKYYFELVVSTGGNSYRGSVQNFTTTSSSPAPQKPVVATGPAGRVSSTGALLTGTINPGGSSPVQYSFSYGSSATTLDHTTARSTQPGGTTAALVSATLTGLAPHTTYYFRLAVSFNGQTYVGAVRTFTTSQPLPGVLTGGTSHVIGDSAVLSGWVNPHGTKTIYQVQFGRSATYGFSTTWIIAGSAASAQLEQIALFGLNPGTTYHYRFVAQNRYGTAVGADRAFTSAPSAGYAPRFRLSAPSRLPWHQVASHPLRVRFRCNKECLAHFVLLVERPGHTRSVTLSVAIGHGKARLRRAGGGLILLRFSPRFRRHLRQPSNQRLPELVLVGYAQARGSGPSPPQQTTIRLTG